VPAVARIDHVTLRVYLQEALDLYARVFELLDFGGTRFDGDGFHEWNDFSLAQADERHRPTRGVHVGFAATSPSQVERWWRALCEDGFEDDGPPGPRPEYGDTYYGAFIRDRDGNSIEAVHHETATPDTGTIDHLWIRVADLVATKRFYTAIAGATGLHTNDRAERLQLVGESGTFSLLEGKPTENLHLAVGVDDAEAVRRFHRAGLEAGGRDNGGPAERPHYHPGYYGAYLLDPDGNNVEAVWHDRRPMESAV
jgi:catechol 2,3-dioxygenase-like lactoylglutathione lyase family enzyme